MENNIESLFNSNRENKSTVVDYASKILSYITEIEDKFEYSSRLEQDGHDGVVDRTEIADELPLIRVAMEDAAAYFREKGFFVEIEYSHNGSLNDGLVPTLWHYALEVSWVGRI